MSIKGKHPTLLKVLYVRPDARKDIKECFQVLYADDNGVVHYVEEPPMVDIYIVKDEFRDYTYNKPQERIDHMDKIRCKYSGIRMAIGKAAGAWGQSIISRAYDTHNVQLMNELYRWPYVYGADFQAEYYYMKQWYDKYPLEKPSLSRAYMDIEIDQIDYTVNMDDVSDTAYAPVNACSVILESTREIYTFLLRPYEPQRMNKTDEEYRERLLLYQSQLKQHFELMEHRKEFADELNKEFDSTYGHFEYHIREYTEEIELIADIFRLINTKKPNFMMIWNMRFDIAYLYSRLEVLGYDPASVMCSPDLPNPRAYFHKDKSTWLIEKQFDFFTVSSYTQYLCQMRTFASIRKSQHKIRSMKLNDVADSVLKDKKVEYDDIGNITLFAYQDWRRFVKYNIKDTLLQYGIENKVNDLLTYYMRSHSNLTPYNKIFRETHLLRNVREIYFEKEGWVQSNNLNVNSSTEVSASVRKFFDIVEEDDGDEKASFKGAINADPLMNGKIGLKVLGVRSNNIFSNAMDYDMGAFYPSIKIISNMDPSTLLYKAMFDNAEFKSGQCLNKSLNQVYDEVDKNGKSRQVDITGEAVNTLCSGNILTFGYNYLGLPNITDLYKMVLSEIVA